MKGKYEMKLQTQDIVLDILEDIDNDFNKLCRICNAIIVESGMTEEEIDKIVKEVKEQNV